MSNSLVLGGAGWAQTPDDPALDITGDIDIRVAAALTDWTPATQEVLVAKWTTGAQSYGFQVLSSGLLNIFWDDDGTGTSISDTSTIAPTVADGAILAVRAALDVDIGGGLRRTTFYTKATTPATAAADCADDTGWTTLGGFGSFVSTSIFSSSTPLTVGSLAAGILPLTGKVYAVVIKNGIAGTTVANPDFTAQSFHTTSFTDGAGRTWTLQGDAAILNDDVTPTTTTSQVPSTMPFIVVEMGFTAGATTGNYLYLDDPARGILDTNTLAPDNLMADVSADVRAFSTHRGSSRAEPVVRPEAGTSSTVLKDVHRSYDPTNLSGPYVSAGITQVVPMVIIRHRATWKGVTYNLWHGFADSFQVSYAQRGNYSEVVVTATDGFKVLQANSRAAVAPVGTGEKSGARVSRILNSAGWSLSDRIIAAGDSTVQSTTLAGEALTELLLVCDSELGEMYVDAAGRLVFRNRNAMVTQSRSNTSQATFGDGPGELPYQSIETEYDEQQLVNQVRITRAGGAAQTENDATSQTKYLVHTYERSDLIMESDSDADDYARFLLYQNKDPELRFSSIKISPQRDPDNLYPQVLGREIGDRISINLRPDNGDPISRDVIIRGITHEVTRTTWNTTWALQAAAKFDFFVLDHPTLGRLDENALAY